MKIKNKILSFIEQKGIAKKVLNYLERKGTVEISLVGLRFIVFIGIISILVNAYFIIKTGVIQQGIYSLFTFLGDCIKNIMYILKDFDENSPGTLSFIGAVVGGGLGFYGATKVFKNQIKINRKQSIDKLMHLLLYTYRMISSFLEIASTDEEFQNGLKKSDLYKQLVYDQNWRNYISEISDYEDKENILRWLFNIENKLAFNREVTKKYLLSIESILNKYGYKSQLNFVKKELKKKDKNKKEESNADA